MPYSDISINQLQDNFRKARQENPEKWDPAYPVDKAFLRYVTKAIRNNCERQRIYIRRSKEEQIKILRSDEANIPSNRSDG